MLDELLMAFLITLLTQTCAFLDKAVLLYYNNRPAIEKRADIGLLLKNGPSAARHRKTGHYRPTSKMPFQLHFAGGPIVARD